MKLLDVIGISGSAETKIKPSEHYLIAFDGELVICYFYNTDAGKEVMERYLKEANATVNIDIRQMTLKKDNEFFELNRGKKIVLLDEKLVLYEEVDDIISVVVNCM